MASEHRSKLLQTAAHYSVGTALGLFGSVARVAIAARLLPHDQSGEWLGLQLAFNYGQNLHFGVLFGMFRNVPLMKARGDIALAERLKDTCLGFILLMCGVGMFGTVVVLTLSTFIAKRYVLETGILTVATLLRSYYVILFRAESRFRELSLSSAVGSTISVASLALIWFWRLDGLIIGMIAQTMTELIYLVVRSGAARPKLDIKLLTSQLGVGFAVLLVAVGTTALTSIDRTVMLKTLGATATGYYYLGANAVAFFPLLAGLPAAVLTPRFFERVGRKEPLLPLVDEPVRIAAVAFAAILGAGALAVPAIVVRAWPGLDSGNNALFVALLMTFPIVLSGLVTNVFYAMNRLVLQIVVLALSTLVSYGAAVVCVRFHSTITAAAVGASTGVFVYYIGAVLAAHAVVGERLTRGVALVLSSLLPLACAAVLVVAIRSLLRLKWHDESLLGTALAEITFVGMMAPWVLRAVRRLRGT